MNRRLTAAASLTLAILLAAGMGAAYVVINEVELNPEGEGYQWVELYNPGDENVSIGEWTVAITDGPWVGEVSIEEGTVIAPKSFYVAEGSKSWAHGNNGTVIMKDARHLEVDRTHYLNDNRDNAFTWSRYPDGKDSNTSGDFAFIMGSKGRANGVPSRFN